MIISASRRTDIPAFYSEWFIKRLQAGFAYIKNPRNPHRIASVELNRDVVDCIVFWTKNAQPMLNKLDIIDSMGYPYYFQFTITPYDHQVEKGLPPKTEIIETFKRLSDKNGKHRVIWRYDPVIVNAEYSVQYHLDRFGEMCDILGGYTNKCTFSFIDLYAKLQRRTKDIVNSEVNTLNMNQIAQGFSAIAEDHDLELATCSEAIDLSSYGISRASCIDQTLIENIIGCSIRAKKDTNQRPHCSCIESIDIGAYDCCSHGCIYCYAMTSENLVSKNRQWHNSNSPMLICHPGGEEIMSIREAKSLKIIQLPLF
jgi:DNA repair photolyase